MGKSVSTARYWFVALSLVKSQTGVYFVTGGSDTVVVVSRSYLQAPIDHIEIFINIFQYFTTIYRYFIASYRFF